MGGKMSRQKKRSRTETKSIATVERPAALPTEMVTAFHTHGEELVAWLAEEVSHAPERFDGPPLLVLDNRLGCKRWRRET